MPLPRRVYLWGPGGLRVPLSRLGYKTRSRVKCLGRFYCPVSQGTKSARRAERTVYSVSPESVRYGRHVIPTVTICLGRSGPTITSTLLAPRLGLRTRRLDLRSWSSGGQGGITPRHALWMATGCRGSRYLFSWPMCGGVIKPGPDGLLYICIRGGALEECARGPGQRTGLGFHTPKSGGFVPFPRVHLVLTTLSFRARCFWCSRATFPPCGDGRYINNRYTALGIAVSCRLTDLIVRSLLVAWWATSCHNTRVRA